MVDIKVRNKSQKMSWEQSEEEDGVVETEVGPVDDEIAETEVDFRPPRDNRPIITGAVGADADKRDPAQTNRFESLSRAKRKRARFELLILRTPGPCRMPSGAGG